MAPGTRTCCSWAEVKRIDKRLRSAGLSDEQERQVDNLEALYTSRPKGVQLTTAPSAHDFVSSNFTVL